MNYKPLSKREESIAGKIVYDGMTFNEGLRLDVLVEGLIICELKVVDQMNSVWEAQIISHLKLTGKCLGFLVNFNVPLKRWH
ncbi:MAG: hypothetical protein SRB2_00516 [Desulfobacteraceae bacterium Eth-SRB2]|nr:MAG: hypothetical protein SRB2_00516 [Desulfobacteraceae bacterium Eth-SRB2]